MRVVHEPTVRLLPRTGANIHQYLARIARISRGIDPFDSNAHEDTEKNKKTLRHCWTKGHLSIFEFWPILFVYPREARRHQPGTFPDGDQSIATVAHLVPVDLDALPPTLPDDDYPCFVIECSRVALAQLTRYRYWVSYNVESQRYVRYGTHRDYSVYVDPEDLETQAIRHAQYCYEQYLHAMDCGRKPEIARYRLPSSAMTRLAMAAPKERWVHFLRQRLDGCTGKPQGEIRQIAAKIAEYVRYVP